MDEVDNIILLSLRQIGCNVDDEIKSLSEFTPSLFVHAVSKCISLINPNLDLPKTLPPGMAQRFTATAALAEACTTVGYRRDIGYQTFLYLNEAEVRRVFMFLIESLPKETEKSSLSQPIDKLTELENEIYTNINQQLYSPWMPEFCKNVKRSTPSSSSSSPQTIFQNFKPKKLNIPFVTEHDIAEEIKEFWCRKSKSISDEICDQKQLIATIISTNDGQQAIESDAANVERTESKSNAIKLLEFNQNLNQKSTTVSPSSAIKTSENSIEQNQNVDKKLQQQQLELSANPLELLNKEIGKLKADIESNLLENNQLVVENQKLSGEKLQREEILVKLKDEKKIKERTHLLLENPEVNIKKLEGIIVTSKERAVKLSEQWEEHRAPLLEAIHESTAKNSVKINKSQQILEQIDGIKQKCEEVTEDLRNKTQLHSRMVQELENANKNVSRTAYTSRILEIIGNIRKQKLDIDHILNDTRSLQKEINTITGQLERQYTVTDDLIFRSATRKDDYSRKAYKLLVQLHQDFDELIKSVQETGTVMREVRDIEDQIDTEKSRNVSTNLERITIDLNAMQSESKILQQKIYSLEKKFSQQT
uniref:Coiled-coil domain-containing protein 22 homolog n=1 Tax=Corethrella appendiculata TaxID=1370023 RepID=U5ENS4_9DIPT